MDGLVKKALKNRDIIIGALLLLVGFAALSAFTWAWWALFLGGILAWAVVFKQSSFIAFSLPKHIWVILLGFIGYMAWSLAVGSLAISLGFSWAANPLSGHLASIIFKIPFMLMGEELLGIGILETARNKGLSLMKSTLFSALIFGLLHSIVYWDGSIISTLLHVLLLQGVARLIFNVVYLKTGGSIWGSWGSHLLVDLVGLAF